jgi:FAD synthase
VKVIRGIPPSLIRAPCALTIGNFDGVHLGHQALLAELHTYAQQHQLQTCLLTFEPHPKEFFAHQNAPARILGLRDKLDALKKTNVDLVIVEHFNAHFAKKTPINPVPPKIIIDFINLPVSNKLTNNLNANGFSFGINKGNQLTLDKPAVGNTLTFDLNKDKLIQSEIKNDNNINVLDKDGNKNLKI